MGIDALEVVLKPNKTADYSLFHLCFVVAIVLAQSFGKCIAGVTNVVGVAK